MNASIVVQIADFDWTLRALHHACAISQQTHSRIVLLQLMPVTNPALLGSGLGIRMPSSHENNELREYSTIAKDYGVECVVQPMVYASQVDALVQIAEMVHASIVFAHFPKKLLPFWKNIVHWSLKRQLAQQGCRLHTLGESEQSDNNHLVSAKTSVVT